MNKNFIILILIALVAWYVIKRKSISRTDMIDFLNANVAYPDGAWTKLTDEELRTVYKPFALIKQNIKPGEEMYLQAQTILNKYGIKIKG